MTTSTIPAKLEETIATADGGTTVFSDGSTFSYTHGYRSNGAAPATRDRAVAPTIVKSYQMVTATRVGATLLTLALVGALAVITAAFVSFFHYHENKEAIEKSIQDSGYAEVVGMNENSVTLYNAATDQTFHCDLSTGEKDGVANAYVFCLPGKASDFTIALPYNKNDLFYSNSSALNHDDEGDSEH